jgi:NAD-dependent deacetylase
MSTPLSDRALRKVLRAAGDMGAVAAAGAPLPSNIDERRRLWREEPLADVELSTGALDGEQVKALVIDQIRLAQIRELRSDHSIARRDRERIHVVQGAPVAILSGAGISVDAGFRTFRGAGGEGLWEKVDPMVLASIDGFEQDPERSLRWYCGRRTRGLRAVPTLAHASISAAQDAQGARWAGVHTQNVDGLHETAGSRGVNRIHGSIWVWRDRRTMHLIFDPSDDYDALPRGPGGDPTVRPGVVMFGDMVSPTVYERAIDEIRGAKAVIVVGTSAQVSTLWPLLHTAQRSADLLIDVNPERTPVTDELGAAHLPFPSGVGVPLALEELGAIEPGTTDLLARMPRPPLRERVGVLGEELVRDDG